MRTLNAGQPVPKGAIGVVAPGTGLGESFLTWDGSKHVPHSSEGGHSDFASTGERQIGLRVLAARWCKVEPTANAKSFMLDTASLSAMGYEHSFSHPVIRLWNDTHHLLTSKA